MELQTTGELNRGISRRQALRTGLVVGGGLLATSLLAACGGGGQSAASAATAAPAAAPTTASTAAPAAAATSVATTAPAAAPTAAPPVTGTGTKVTFWYNYAGAYEKLITGMIDAFNKSQTNFTVSGESKKTYNDLYKANLAAIQAGDPATMSIAYENQVAQFQKSGLVVAFDDYIANAQYGLTAADKQDIFPAFLELGKFPQFGNKQLTFPAGKSLEMMWYNADLIKKAGFTTPPKTWDDFKSQVAKTTTGGAVGFTMKPDASRFATQVFSRGGDLITPDGTKITVNTPQGQASMELLQALNKAKQMHLVSPKGYNDENMFAAQKAVFWQESSTSRGYIAGAINTQKGATFNWQDEAIPVGTAGSPHSSDLYGGNFALFKTKPQPQLGAWEFVKFFAHTDNTVKWALATGYMPLRKSAANTPDYKKFLAENPRNGVAFQHLNDPNKSEPKVAAWQQVRDILQAMIQDVITNGASPTQALADAEKKANAALQQS